MQFVERSFDTVLACAQFWRSREFGVDAVLGLATIWRSRVFGDQTVLTLTPIWSSQFGETVFGDRSQFGTRELAQF